MPFVAITKCNMPFSMAGPQLAAAATHQGLEKEPWLQEVSTREDEGKRLVEWEREGKE